MPVLNILLVEDYPDNRTITIAYLQGTPIGWRCRKRPIAVEKFVLDISTLS